MAASRPTTYTPSTTAPAPPASESKLTKSASSAPRGKGMALGKKSKQSDLFEAMRDKIEAASLMATAAPVVEVSHRDQTTVCFH